MRLSAHWLLGVLALRSLNADTTNGSSFSQLQADIATGNVELSGVIEFNRTLIIPFGHNVTIRGESKVTTLLDGGGLSRLFVVEGQLRVLNLTISNGRARNGGAFYVVNGTLDIVDCTIRGNVADGFGGAVFNSQGTVRFQGGVTHNNTAVRGGVVYNEEGSLHINGGLFHNNTAAQAGGVGYNFRGRSTLTVATFSSNAVTNSDGVGNGGVFCNEEHTGSALNVTWEYNGARWGGAIYNDHSKYEIWDSQCKYNQAEGGACFYVTQSTQITPGNTSSHNAAYWPSEGGPWGGAVYHDAAPTLFQITGIACESNRANNGGAFYVVNGTLDIIDCTLRGNVADGWGGVVFNSQGTVRFQGGVTHNNTAVRGGVVYSEGASLHINGGLFHGNTAAQAGGVGYNVRGSSTLAVAIFSSNAVTNRKGIGNGGVFCNEEHTGSAINVTWEHNGAKWGGAIFNDASTYEIWDSQCTYNQAERGGCFYFTESAHIISGGNYSYNTAARISGSGASGGAVYDIAPTYIHLTGIACESNRAYTGGCYAISHVNNDQKDVKLSKCLFRNNIALKNGGSIWINEADVRFVLADNQFLDGSGAAGGFLYIAQGKKKVTVTRSSFSRGSASDRGGAIFTTSRLTLRRSRFTACDAFKGGVLFIGIDALIMVDNVTMIENRATLFGGAIFNERSPSISLEGESMLMGNIAEVSGGAIYSQAQSSVISGNNALPSQLINNSANSGGGVSVQAGVYLELQALSFISNEAVRGAVHGGEGAHLVLQSTTFSLNVATGEGGALFLQPGAVAAILESDFSNNSATSGGVAYIGHSGLLTSFRSKLNYNRAHSGGAIAGSGARINAENTDWVSNVADHGGAFFLSDSQFVSAGGCTYALNRASYGGIANLEEGSELFLNQTDRGTGNSAMFGGGVAFYDHRTTARPLDPPPNITATALFGTTFATGLSSIRALHHGPEVNEREFENPIRFKAYDDLGNAYRTPDIETIELAPRQGSLVGTTLLYLQDGQAETSEIRVSYQPDANVTIVARIAQIVTSLNVTLRACYKGEIGNDCRACADSGKYSLDPRDDACLDCPKHASCNSEQATNPDLKGAVLVLKAGYWRSGPFSTNIRKCPYAEACKGGVDLLTMEDSCRERHRGPMCTLCKNVEETNEEYLLDRSTGKCHKCASKTWFLIVVVLVLTIAFVVIAPIAVLTVLSHEHNLLFTDFLRQTCRSLEQSRLVRTIEEFMPMIKIVFVFSQVVSSEYSTFLFVNYPSMFDKVNVGLSFSQNFAAHAILASFCIRINHYSELLSVTLVPIVIVVLSELSHFLASLRTTTEHLLKKIRNYATFVKLVTLFIVYSTASLVICTTFRCDDDFRKEEEGSRYLKASYLAVDYSISCKKSVHKIYVTYSALMVFVYPVGVPLYFFCLLWLHRQIINPDAKVLAEEILSRDLEDTFSMRTSSEKKTEEKGTHESAGVCNNVAAEEDMRLQASHYARAVILCEEYEALRPLIPCLGTLSENLVASHARLDRRIAHLGFLFCDYSPDCWWFESLECIRRLFLTAVFPAVYSVDNDAGLLYSTFLISTLFLGVYWATQPFVDEGVNRFAVLMHAALSLILFLTIVLYSEERLNNAESARWDRKAIGVVLILLSTCLAPIMVIFEAQLGGFQIYSRCTDCCRHSIMLDDIDHCIAADVDEEKQKDSGGHFELVTDSQGVQTFDKTTAESALNRDEGNGALEISGADRNDNANKQALRFDDSSSDPKPLECADSSTSNFSGKLDFNIFSLLTDNPLRILSLKS